MAAKTYNDIIDAVMIKLREAAVTELTDDYTLLVGEWVNTTKEKVEDAWDWRAGRKTVTFSSVAGQRDYDLSDTVDGSGDADSGSNVTNRRSKLLFEKTPIGNLPMAYDVTDAGSDSGFRLIRMQDSLRRSYDLRFASQSVPKPLHFSITRNTNGLQLSFREEPEEARDYALVFYIPDNELDSLDDELTVAPFRTVVLGTLWLVAAERGEELGLNTNLLERLYMDRLAQEITTDMEESDAIMVPV